MVGSVSVSGGCQVPYITRPPTTLSSCAHLDDDDEDDEHAEDILIIVFASRTTPPADAVSAMECSDLWTLARQRFRVRLALNGWGQRDGCRVFSCRSACSCSMQFMCIPHGAGAGAVARPCRALVAVADDVFALFSYLWIFIGAASSAGATVCQNANDLLN